MKTYGQPVRGTRNADHPEGSARVAKSARRVSPSRERRSGRADALDQLDSISFATASGARLVAEEV